MKPYLFALGAFFCWGSLPAATGSGLQGLRVPGWSQVVISPFVWGGMTLILASSYLFRRFG